MIFIILIVVVIGAMLDMMAPLVCVCGLLFAFTQMDAWAVGISVAGGAAVWIWADRVNKSNGY